MAGGWADQVDPRVGRQLCQHVLAPLVPGICHVHLLGFITNYVPGFVLLIPPPERGAVNVVDDEVDVLLLFVHGRHHLGRLLRHRGGAALHLQHLVEEEGREGEEVHQPPPRCG